MSSKRRPPRTRSAPPSPPLHLRTPATKQLPARVSKKTVKTHSNRIERHAARGGAAEGGAGAREARKRRRRESSRSGLGALKSTGSRRRVPRSATSVRAPSRQDVSHQLQPAAAPDLGHYRPAAPASPVICRGSSNSSILIHIRNHRILNQRSRCK